VPIAEYYLAAILVFLTAGAAVRIMSRVLSRVKTEITGSRRR
jgi:hypothetical protein